jgi:lipooligosaccharide transport system permease protein
LFQTPMLLLSGVFFPVDQMPATLRAIAAVLPLSHAIDIARPLLAGRILENILLHLAVLAAYAGTTYYLALVLTRRRLLK